MEFPFTSGIAKGIARQINGTCKSYEQKAKKINSISHTS